MNNIELIIRHLSGEASEEEIKQLEGLLKSDTDFRNEYESISEIWDRIKEKIKLEDLGDGAGREEILASIEAARALDDYEKDGRPEHSDFLESLKSVMEASDSDRDSDKSSYGAGDKTSGKGSEISDQDRVEDPGYKNVTEESAQDAFEQTVFEKEAEGIKEAGDSKARSASPRIRNMVFIAAAAALLLFLLIPKNDPLVLSEKYITESESLLSEANWFAARGSEKELIAFFSEEDYARVLATSNPDSVHPNLGVLIALSHFEQGDTLNCIAILEEISHSSANIQASWYLSLSYVLAGESEKALELLEELSLVADNYKREKEKLLAGLRKSR